MRFGPVPGVTVPELAITPEKPNKNVPFGGSDEPEEVEVSAEGGKLQWIKYKDGTELASNKEILLNGKQTNYADAKGKAKMTVD